jgi:hypothetical protein
MPDGAVYVGRPSQWGNPIIIEATPGEVWDDYYGAELRGDWTTLGIDDEEPEPLSVQLARLGGSLTMAEGVPEPPPPPVRLGRVHPLSLNVSHAFACQLHETKTAAAAWATMVYAHELKMFRFDLYDREREEAKVWLAPLVGRDLVCWCPIWDETTPCPHVATLGPCPVCEGTGYARYPCHGDALLRAANTGITFPWDHRPLFDV